MALMDGREKVARMSKTMGWGGQAVGSRWVHILCAASVWLIVGGCAPVTLVDEVARPGQMETPKQGDPLKWHYARFRLHRPDDDGVNSYLDLMLADQVIAPVIERHGEALSLWRFHRRWPEDATGHQFSFIFYAPAGVAASVDQQIQNHPVLVALGKQGHLNTYHMDEGQVGNVAAASDPAWPATIQHEWPVFIMGASRMWLGLLQSEAALHDTPELHERYRATEKALDALWFDQGNHAFFHHLSALFGYKPLRVIRRDVMTF